MEGRDVRYFSKSEETKERRKIILHSRKTGLFHSEVLAGLTGPRNIPGRSTSHHRTWQGFLHSL